MVCPSGSSRQPVGAGLLDERQRSLRSGARPQSTRVSSRLTSTATPAQTPRRVPDFHHDRGLIDTSIVIGLERIDPEALPRHLAIAAITLAELAAGPHATSDASERARRQQRLQLAEATFDPLPVNADCARAYGLVYAETVRAGRKARGARAIDLLIAATALAGKLPVYTANPAAFEMLTDLVEVQSVTLSPA